MKYLLLGLILLGTIFYDDLYLNCPIKMYPGMGEIEGGAMKCEGEQTIALLQHRPGQAPHIVRGHAFW